MSMGLRTTILAPVLHHARTVDPIPPVRAWLHSTQERGAEEQSGVKPEKSNDCPRG